MNPALLHLAQARVWKDMEKTAVVAPGADQAAMGGAPPGGGMPPGGGGAPPMDPATMGGGAPPMDPAAMGGGMPPQGGAPAAPPMDPSMMGGAMPGMMPGMPGQAPQKMKPEQMMQMLDFRLYNMQQQMTALMNHLQVSVAPGALVTPPGSPTPVAEAALPGGPQDPGAAAGGGDPAAAGGGGGSAIGGIEPIQGASPELAAAGGGGGEKAAGWSPLMDELFRDEDQGFSGVGQPIQTMFGGSNVTTNAGAVAAMLRQRTGAA
jgi:hypothetical protein